MDILRWMKGTCVVTVILGGVGYLLFLGRWLYVMWKEGEDWLHDFGM